MVAKEFTSDKLMGPEKAAIFLMAMGEEYSAELFKTLDNESIKQVGRYMAEISYVPQSVLRTVLNEFITNCETDNDLAVSGRHFVEQIINRTKDDKTAKEVLKLLGDESDHTPFKDLEYIPADKLVHMFKGEHPQSIALVLSHLSDEKAAETLSLLPEEGRSDIAFRIATIGEVQDDVIRELDEVITKDVSGLGRASKKFDGLDTLVSILNAVDKRTEESILGSLEEQDSDFADKVRQKMFVFEDLLEVEDRYFREILQAVSNDVMVKAMKTASEGMKEKIFKNLSERAAEMLRDDLDVLGPVRLSEVEECQQNIIKTAKSLEAEGKMVLSVKDKEDVFV